MHRSRCAITAIMQVYVRLRIIENLENRVEDLKNLEYLYSLEKT